MNKIVEKALEIATRDLRSCYEKEGIVSGRHHFEEYWARDNMWACLGAMELGDWGIVEKSLNQFILNISKEGQVPLSLSVPNKRIFRVLGLDIVGRKKPEYNLHPLYFLLSTKWGAHHFPKDGNALLTIIAVEYAMKRKDKVWLGDRIATLEKVMVWYEGNLREGLVHEDWYESWADSLKMKGWVAYTNVLYVRALEKLAEGYELLAHQEKSQKWRAKCSIAKQALIEKLWNGKYLRNWVGTPGSEGIFVVDANMWAAYWGILDNQQTQYMVDEFLSLPLSDPLPAKTNWPAYPAGTVPLGFKLIGLGGYHNAELAWVAMGAIAALVVKKYRPREGESLLSKIAEVVVRDGEVYEVYGKDGKPFRSWLYKSEHPFAWGSGILVWAITNT